MNYLLRLAYDGTNYCGFQVQPNGVSVSAVIQNAMEAVFGTRPDIKGCSRTDAGVHALDFALNFHVNTQIPVQKLPLALNAHLPEDVRVKSAMQVPEEFHARYAAHEKTYRYRIRNSAVESPFDAKYSVKISQPLDVDSMNAAAKELIGTYDFTSFCAAGSSAAAHGDTVRTVSSCHVKCDGEIIEIEITADGYLYNMVRIIAGTLVQVGRGQRLPQEINQILQAKDRSKAGPTLPAKGLFLAEVCYDIGE